MEHKEIEKHFMGQLKALNIELEALLQRINRWGESPEVWEIRDGVDTFLAQSYEAEKCTWKIPKGTNDREKRKRQFERQAKLAVFVHGLEMKVSQTADVVNKLENEQRSKW